MLEVKEIEECQNLNNWTREYRKNKDEYILLDSTLEWLADSGYLNRKGKRFAKRFGDWTWLYFTNIK